MRYTSERLTTSEGEIGVPPDWTPKFPTWQGPEPFDLGTQCAFICGKSSIRQTVNVEKAGTYWVTLSLAVDQASPGWPPTVCRILVDGSDRTSRPLPIGGFDFKTVSFNYAASNCFHLEPGAHEIVIEGISEKGTLYADSVHVCSEDAFYGGLGAPNFPSGGNAFGQVAATGYYKTAHAECDMAYNWGLVPCTYEGGWAVQSDFDHYSMLAWDDLRYGGHDTHSELTQQALQNCFDVWCKRGGFIYAYFYPFQRNIAQTDAPLYQRILAMNDRLTPFPDTGGPIPGTLDCDQPHYQFDPSKEWSYHGPSTGNPEKGRTVPARGWKSWIVTCKETSDYRIALVASGGGAELLVDGAAVAGGDAAGNPGVKVKLVAGVHSIKVKSADQAVNVEKITVEKAKSE